MSFDGDAALALDIHGIEHLLLHFAHTQATAQLNHAVSQGGLTVINMRDDGEVADMGQIGAHDATGFSTPCRKAQGVTGGPCGCARWTPLAYLE